MQTIEYQHFQDVFLLYRGGMRYHKDIKDGEDKGYDPYERYRVIPREEIMYQDTPKDKTTFGFSMAQSLLEEPIIYTYDYHPHIDKCKPYLCPMSSMTEEEEKRDIIERLNQ